MTDPAGRASLTDDALLPARWSALHHDIDLTRIPLLSGWLRVMWAGGRLLARAHVPPTVVTACGVASATAAVTLAGTSPGVAGIGVLGAAVCDGLDGAVAVVADRATRSGALADAVADRYCDVAFAVVVARCGAPRWMAATAASLAVGVDTLRRVRRVPAKVTVAERPTFTICALLACGSASVLRSRWPVRLCAAVWIGAGVVGVGQLLGTPRGSTPAGALATG